MNSNTAHLTEEQTQTGAALRETMRKACKLIAPVWPLENFVAVNPYLGHTNQKFEEAAQDLAAAGAIQMTLPVQFYLDKIESGEITAGDIKEGLDKRGLDITVEDFLKSVEQNATEIEDLEAVASLADVATQTTSKNWNRLVMARITTWASSYFDKGQASWKATHASDKPFEAWRKEASVDRTPEFLGLKGFRQKVQALPKDPVEATAWALQKLGIDEKGTPLYLHRILLKHGGWSAFAARVDWDNELYGGEDGVLIEFLAILTCWEACLLESLNDEELNRKWNKSKAVFSIVKVQREINDHLKHKIVLQEAFDRAGQNRFIDKFNKKERNQKPETKKDQTLAQAVFCIDVRSEVFRRNLEMVDQKIETLGFAGFFGFPISYVPLGQEEGEANCPVLLPTGATIKEQLPEKGAHQAALEKRVANRQLQQVWKSFKSSAVSNFSFVSPMGLSFLPKLFTDSFGWTRPVPNPNTNGLSKKAIEEKSVDAALTLPIEQQIQMAKNALTAMSLKDNFAKFIMIAGHGSSMVNNPHATGYDCGACGGHSGEGNARAAAAVLNNREVRAGLQEVGIFIPVNTTFLACLHDTTTDEFTIYNEVDVHPEAKNELEKLKESLEKAGKLTRTERSLRFTAQGLKMEDKEVLARSKDWSQTRPEWGLAGCSAFVVAPRERTKDINLEGQSFLHSYDWKTDEGFSVLELIMTAPMVVTSWINLQYYGSTVDNVNYGSGNKTLHNVTGGIGVLEGHSGDLRTGLPWQAIHDGEKFQHEPLRLNVMIEAPREAMNNILAKHAGVKDLCDNGWIQLLAIDEDGRVSHRYTGDLSWEQIQRVAA